jgi:hypothetical protein
MDPHDVVMAEKTTMEVADTTSASESKMANPTLEAGAQGEEKWDAIVQERGLVPHVKAAEGSEEDEEQEYDLAGEEAKGVVQMVRWLAIARFYSSHVLNAKIMFEELCNVWGDMTARVIGVNSVKPWIFIENPNPCTIAIVPESVAIAYRMSHR